MLWAFGPHGHVAPIARDDAPSAQEIAALSLRFALLGLRTHHLVGGGARWRRDAKRRCARRDQKRGIAYESTRASVSERRLPGPSLEGAVERLDMGKSKAERDFCECHLVATDVP